MELIDSFGEWLKSRRKTLDLTQEELAGRAGCSVFALRKIESGERRPSKQLAGLLAEALQIPEEDKQDFVRAARGDMAPGRLRAPPPSPASFSGAPAAPGTSPEPAPHQLPLPPTLLLGRESELNALERLFTDPPCRLLTLSGMGGIGKTRLAIEFAVLHKNLFPDGVIYVPLGPINSAESIVPAVAEAQAFSFSGPSEPKEQLFNFMSNGMKHPALMILDNLEHLIAQSSTAVELVIEFLERLPHLKILCTSRERLNLQGEWVYELHGLPVPPDEFAERLDDYSAVRLFLQGAQRIKTDFQPDGGDKASVIRICRLLEGVPLAIELASAWTGLLSCAEIAHELESSIDILSTSLRDMPERHRSMRASFDHSWRLLSETEREAMCCLSVFQGGFDREAAEKVAGASLAILASLASKSLVRRGEDGRYDLHEVIRQYSLPRLAEDQARHDEVRDRQCEYYLNFASRYERKLKSSAQQSAIQDMTAELDNLRAAWEWGIRRGKFGTIVKSVRSFGWFFEVSGLIRDGIEQLELLIQSLSEKKRNTEMNRALGAALTNQGLLYFRAGQFARAQERYKQSIAILRSINARVLLADPLIFSGTLLHLNGDYLEAKELIEEGTGYARATGDQWFTAYGIYNLGHVDSLMGKYEEGYEQMLEGMKIWREVGDPHSISLGLNFLVDTQIALGRYEEAKASMRESIALCEQTKNRWGMGTAYRYLGLTTLAEGQCVEARDCFQKSLEVFGEQFEGWDIARTLTYLGDAVLKSGDCSGAESSYKEALRIAREAKSMPIILDALTGLAEIDQRTGKVERAYQLSHVVLSQSACAQETKGRACRIIAEIAKLDSTAQEHAIQKKIPNQSLEEWVRTVLK